MAGVDPMGRHRASVSKRGLAERARRGWEDFSRWPSRVVGWAGRRLRADWLPRLPCSCNWPYGPPEDGCEPQQCDNPPDEPEDDDKDDEDDDCEKSGSIIHPATQTLGEAIPIAGSPFAMIYSSNRMPGYHVTIEVPATSAEPPASLLAVHLKMTIAGRVFHRSFTSIQPNLVGACAASCLARFLRIALTLPAFCAATCAAAGPPAACCVQRVLLGIAGTTATCCASGRRRMWWR